MAPVETVEMIDKMTDEAFKRHVLEILHREIGVYGLVRFVRISRAGSGDYTRDRLQWLAGLSVEDVIARL
jgi:hypothetical protein